MGWFPEIYVKRCLRKKFDLLKHFFSHSTNLLVVVIDVYLFLIMPTILQSRTISILNKIINYLSFWEWWERCTLSTKPKTTTKDLKRVGKLLMWNVLAEEGRLLLGTLPVAMMTGGIFVSMTIKQQWYKTMLEWVNNE